MASAQPPQGHSEACWAQDVHVSVASYRPSFEWTSMEYVGRAAPTTNSLDIPTLPFYLEAVAENVCLPSCVLSHHLVTWNPMHFVARHSTTTQHCEIWRYASQQKARGESIRALWARPLFNLWQVDLQTKSGCPWARAALGPALAGGVNVVYLIFHFRRASCLPCTQLYTGKLTPSPQMAGLGLGPL